MLEDGRKDVDEELVDSFLQSPDSSWQIWKRKGSEEPALDAATYSALIQRFPKIPETEVERLNFFLRHDTDVTTRAEFFLGWLFLPALQLRFQDQNRVTHVGFIEGRKNLNNFLREFIKKYNKQCPLEDVFKKIEEGLIE